MKLRMERTQHSLITEGVLEHEQTLSVERPFWVFFMANIGIAYWLIGDVVASMGLSFSDGMFALFVGSTLGALLPAILAIMGPTSRLSQVEAGRFSLGKEGKKLPAFLNWTGCIGWDVIGNILSAAAFVALLKVFHVDMPTWLALGVLIGIQLLIGVYGHHLIQDIAKYTGGLLGLFFVIIGIIAMHKTSFVNPEHPAAFKDVVSAITLLMACNISWAPYATDYTRYLPVKTSNRKIFLAVFSGLFLSLFLLALFGFMTASTIQQQTPTGVMKALQDLSGRFSPLILVFIAFNSIANNAVNDNSAAYSLMSAGLKLSRPVSTIFGGILGYVVCLLATDTFISFFENFLFLFAHWIAPWSAIVLVHWFMKSNKKQSTPSGITSGFVIFFVVSALSIGLFSANSLYTGLLSESVGGVDMGPYIGVFTAAISYYAWLKLSAPSRK